MLLQQLETSVFYKSVPTTLNAKPEKSKVEKKAPHFGLPTLAPSKSAFLTRRLRRCIPKLEPGKINCLDCAGSQLKTAETLIRKQTRYCPCSILPNIPSWWPFSGTVAFSTVVSL